VSDQPLRNPYEPPKSAGGASAPASNAELYIAGVITISRIAALAVAFYWALSYHDALSNFVGRHYPSASAPFAYAAVMAQAFVIESLVCLPLVFPLAFLYGRFTVIAALLLAGPVVARVIWEAPGAPKPPLGPALFAFHGLCHIAFLVGGSKIAALRLQRSNLSIERTSSSWLRQPEAAAHVGRVRRQYRSVK
jgi:hypothetical protein